MTVPGGSSDFAFLVELFFGDAGAALASPAGASARINLIVVELLMIGAISFIVISLTSVPFTCVMSCPTEIVPVASAWPPASTALMAAPLPVAGFFISLTPSVLPSEVSSVTVPGGSSDFAFLVELFFCLVGDGDVAPGADSSSSTIVNLIVSFFLISAPISFITICVTSVPLM